jgi:hypothetical protein
MANYTLLVRNRLVVGEGDEKGVCDVDVRESERDLDVRGER